MKQVGDGERHSLAAERVAIQLLLPQITVAAVYIMLKWTQRILNLAVRYIMSMVYWIYSNVIESLDKGQYYAQWLTNWSLCAYLSIGYRRARRCRLTNRSFLKSNPTTVMRSG